MTLMPFRSNTSGSAYLRSRLAIGLSSPPAANTPTGYREPRDSGCQQAGTAAGGHATGRPQREAVHGRTRAHEWKAASGRPDVNEPTRVRRYGDRHRWLEQHRPRRPWERG